MTSSTVEHRRLAEQRAGTVKTYLDNIYRKLGVNIRKQATVQAQILELV